MNNRITHCFLDTDFRNQHAGLTLIAKKSHIQVSQLKPGQHLMFINSAQNKMKLFSANNIVSYLKLDRGRIDLAAIQHFSSCFSSNLEMTYATALKKRLQDVRIN